RFAQPLDVFGNPVDERGDSRDERGRVVDPASYVTGDDGRVIHDAQRDAEYTRALGDEVVRSFRRNSAFMPTNLVARVLYARAAPPPRSRLSRRLWRPGGGGADAPDARGDPARLARALAEPPEHGAIADRWQAAPPGHILDAAPRIFRGYPPRP